MTELSKKQQQIINSLVADLQQVDGVVALALGGSFARGTAKPDSDIDIGLYYHDDKPFAIDKIRVIAEKYHDETEVTVTDIGGWGRWINGGAWLTIDGQRVDFLYRSVDRLQQVIDDCVAGKIEYDLNQLPATGFYNYIYLGELKICHPLLDTESTLQNLKAQVEIYPPKLKESVLGHFSWITDFLLVHAEKAAKRDDVYMLVGNLHRALSCIVQMIYAQNEQYFISDKGAIAECSTFENIPENFAERANQALKHQQLKSVQIARQLLAEITT